VVLRLAKQRRRRGAGVSGEMLAQMSPSAFPYVTTVITEIMQSGRQEDFEFGLDLILEGLDRRLKGGRSGR
jgi:Tetracyclin repressor-like, C-terminal domain